MRPLYLCAGLLSVGFAIAGAALPLLPTVPFLLLAAFFFARSNPAWERRILDHPTFGPQVRDWRERGAISRRAKLYAILGMSVGTIFTWYTLGHPWYLASLAILITVGAWMWTRPE